MDIFEDGWKLKKTVDVNDLSHPVMIHDCATTENYAIVLYFPLTVKPIQMLQNNFPVKYDPDNGACIGLVSRKEKKKKNSKIYIGCQKGFNKHQAR